MFPNYFVYFNRVIAKSKSVIVVYNDCFITNSGVPGSSFTYYMNSLWDKLGSCVLTNVEYETSKYKFHSIDKPLPVTWKSRERGYEGIADVLWSLEEIDPYFTRRGGQFMVWCAVFLFGSTHSFFDRQEQRATGTSSYWVCLDFKLSVSLPTASGDESGAAAALVLQKTHRFKELSDTTSD